MYYKRLIDKYLQEWVTDSSHKPILLRGARQVGKSTAARHLGAQFENYIEINFEKSPQFKTLFEENLEVQRIVPQMAAMYEAPIIAGKTLLFLDEIQECPKAIMALRFFKEDMPELHVIAAGSLLEFAIQELPTFGVGRIHSMFMYPMTFDEFLEACGKQLLMEARNQNPLNTPMPDILHNKLIELMRNYMLIGGMPEVVAKWVATGDYLQCQKIQDDILISYEDDFPKYRKKVDPNLLRLTMRSAATQAGNKFVYAQVGTDYNSSEVKKALEMLCLSGILTPITHTAANGLPLGSEADYNYRKMLLLDTGLMLRLLNMSIGNSAQITTEILTANAAELINKGAIAEQIAGLELLRYRNPNLRHELYYWQRKSKSSQAEIDYLTPYNQKVLPIEVKAGVQGGMKSLWLFMREKKLSEAVRCSLENFNSFTYNDPEDNNAPRKVIICPLYAISKLNKLI